MKELLVCLLVVAWLCDPVAANQTQGNVNAKVKKAKSSAIKEEKGVLILKKSNFDQALRQHKQLLVNFHEPLSGESQTLSIEFTKAAEHLKAVSFKVHLGVIDVSKEKDLAKELNVTGSQSLRLYISGDKQNPVTCPVMNKASSIITWLERRNGRSAELIKDLNQVEVFVTVENVVVMGFFKVLFVLIDTDEHKNGRILEYFRVRDVETPSVRMVNLTDNVQYQMQSEEVTSDKVTAFCQMYFDGKAKPKLQSEPVPKDWDKRPVKELVGSNFEKVAFNEKRNVFILFYATWCKECQEFFQLWEKLGQVYEKHESVVIGRIDATANDINILSQQRYPSLMFFPAVFSEKVVPYLGDRTLEALVQFVENQVELAKDEKAKEEKEREKYIEAQKSQEKIKEEL
ncbi:hypothetical protein AAFF_G00080710 [Aldrovandia affinis]|uniref:Thioredoxin domain-containing protein n=1 Tax=Aldrovandia affinis TaxID=143900 RepID=A0AAD7WZ65_9TELE|nr:hypothetical protein AAFF_G00080710 [Aldrovandia affinis]